MRASAFLAAVAIVTGAAACSDATDQATSAPTSATVLGRAEERTTAPTLAVPEILPTTSTSTAATVPPTSTPLASLPSTTSAPVTTMTLPTTTSPTTTTTVLPTTTTAPLACPDPKPLLTIAPVTVAERQSGAVVQYEYALTGTVHNPTNIVAYVGSIFLTTLDGRYFGSVSLDSRTQDPIDGTEPLLGPGITWEWNHTIPVYQTERPDVPSIKGKLQNAFWNDTRYVGCPI